VGGGFGGARRDLALFPALYNVVGLLLTGASVSFAFIRGFFLPDKLAVTFLFGVIAGAYYYSERNLPVLMAFHVVLDMIAFCLPFLT